MKKIINLLDNAKFSAAFTACLFASLVMFFAHANTVYAMEVREPVIVAEFTKPVVAECAVVEESAIEIAMPHTGDSDASVEIVDETEAYEAYETHEEIQTEPVTPDMITYANEDGWPILKVDIEGYNAGDAIYFQRKGTFRWNEWRWTYYTSKIEYTHHWRTSEWFACDDGFYRTAEGYIVLASQHHEKETILDTPFGEGIVLDWCGTEGTIDIYTHY